MKEEKKLNKEENKKAPKETVKQTKEKNESTKKVEPVDNKKAPKQVAKPVKEKKDTVKTVEEADNKKAEKKEPSHDYHVTKREDKMWQVKNAGSTKVLKLFKTQKEAIDYASNLVKTQDGNLIIHKEDGKIRKIHY